MLVDVDALVGARNATRFVKLAFCLLAAFVSGLGAITPSLSGQVTPSPEFKVAVEGLGEVPPRSVFASATQLMSNLREAMRLARCSDLNENEDSCKKANEAHLSLYELRPHAMLRWICKDFQDTDCLNSRLVFAEEVTKQFRVFGRFWTQVPSTQDLMQQFNLKSLSRF